MSATAASARCRRIYLEAGFDASGKLMAWQHRLVGDRVTPFADPVRYEKAGKKDFILMLGADAKGYDVPHQLVEQVYEDTGVRTAPLRGIGFTANKFATETFVDEIALKHGVDPVKYRLELLAKTPRAHKVMERAAQMADWGRKRDGTALGAAYIDYSGTQIAAVVEISLDRSTGKSSAQCLVRDRLRRGGAAGQRRGADRKQHRLWHRARSDRAHQHQGRRGRAVELLRLHRVAQQRRAADARRGDRRPTTIRPASARWRRRLITPAVSNALMALTGVRLRHAPFTEERVKKALG